ncbi:taste receptor type 2 member 134-like [Dromiciops gliroides]|uniref:taste receptor type 2 member 134-like n=1 Tax=Dromiciops gliroides TaxID=33562 RepID=UPI001CC65727|nr:taste receptor type 2 member 134-like [Dromiciops gliroides]
MPSLLILFFMILILLESVIAIIENGFIIIVLGREWVTCWKLPPGDMILASLGISCLFLHWTAILSNFHTYFSPINRIRYLDIFWNFINMTTFWFTIWLAIFYCVKISSFTHPIFLWLKWRISRWGPCLLLSSLLISILICIPFFVKTYQIFQLPVSGNYSEKTTSDDRIYAFQRHFLLPQRIIILLIPFFLFLVSTILLISFLCRHLGNMQQNNAGFLDSSMQVYITTLKTLFFFLILYTSYLLPLIISIMILLSVCSSQYWV